MRKICDKKKLPEWSSEVSVSLKVKELAVIYVVLGDSTQAKVREAFDKRFGKGVFDKIAGDLNEGFTIFQEIDAILKEEGAL